MTQARQVQSDKTHHTVTLTEYRLLCSHDGNQALSMPTINVTKFTIDHTDKYHQKDYHGVIDVLCSLRVSTKILQQKSSGKCKPSSKSIYKNKLPSGPLKNFLA
jgi:hypothetical protein